MNVEYFALAEQGYCYRDGEENNGNWDLGYLQV